MAIDVFDPTAYMLAQEWVVSNMFSPVLHAITDIAGSDDWRIILSACVPALITAAIYLWRCSGKHGYCEQPKLSVYWTVFFLLIGTVGYGARSALDFNTMENGAIMSMIASWFTAAGIIMFVTRAVLSVGTRVFQYIGGSYLGLIASSALFFWLAFQYHSYTSGLEYGMEQKDWVFVGSLCIIGIYFIFNLIDHHMRARSQKRYNLLLREAIDREIQL